LGIKLGWPGKITSAKNDVFLPKGGQRVSNGSSRFDTV